MVVIGLSAGKTDVGMAYCNGFGCRHWWMLRAGRYEAKPKSSVAVVLGGESTKSSVVKSESDCASDCNSEKVVKF